MDYTQSIEERLRKIEERTEQNHELLVKMRRVQRNANLFRLLYWLVIIGLTAGAFYFIEPYLNQLTEVYSGFKSGQDTLKANIPDVKNLQNLLDQIKGIQ